MSRLVFSTFLCHHPFSGCPSLLYSFQISSLSFTFHRMLGFFLLLTLFPSIAPQIMVYSTSQASFGGMKKHRSHCTYLLRCFCSLSRPAMVPRFLPLFYEIFFIPTPVVTTQRGFCSPLSSERFKVNPQNNGVPQSDCTSRQGYPPWPVTPFHPTVTFSSFAWRSFKVCGPSWDSGLPAIYFLLKEKS